MSAWLLRAWLGLLLVFAVVPGIDPAVSGLFFDARAMRFPLAQSGVLDLLRHAIWHASNLMLLVALVFGAHALLATRAPQVPGRVWGFALLLILLGPILLVNGVLKALWGRARPADTDLFGGAHPFTGPWQIAPHCGDNCSFVSGEAAAVTCLAILLGLLLWTDAADRRKLLWLLGALVVIGAGMRVMKGRHYLSDALWSVLLMATLAQVLWQRLKVGAVIDRVTGQALRADAAEIWRWLRGAGR